MKEQKALKVWNSLCVCVYTHRTNTHKNFCISTSGKKKKEVFSSCVLFLKLRPVFSGSRLHYRPTQRCRAQCSHPTATTSTVPVGCFAWFACSPQACMGLISPSTPASSNSSCWSFKMACGCECVCPALCWPADLYCDGG